MVSRDDVRRIAVNLPGTAESLHFDAPSFRVNKKIFAVLREPDRVTIKLDPEDQRNLIDVYPEMVGPVSGPGRRIASAAKAGWTFVRYGLCDAAHIERLLRLAWSGVAPRSGTKAP